MYTKKVYGLLAQFLEPSLYLPLKIAFSSVWGQLYKHIFGCYRLPYINILCDSVLVILGRFCCSLDNDYVRCVICLCLLQLGCVVIVHTETIVVLHPHVYMYSWLQRPILGTLTLSLCACMHSPSNTCCSLDDCYLLLQHRV